MKNKTKIIITVIVVLLAVGVFFAWKHHDTSLNQKSSVTITNKKNNSINYAPPTKLETQAGEQTKQQNVEPSSTSTSSSSSTQSTTVTISRLSQSSPGQDVNLRTTLSSNVSDGQCVAVFTQAGQTSITQTVNIVNDPTYYSCDPIDVPSTQFGDSGTWQVVVYVQVGTGIVSNEATDTIVVQQ